MIALTWLLRVVLCSDRERIDLHQLESIQFGWRSFMFKDDDSSSLTIRSDDMVMN